MKQSRAKTFTKEDFKRYMTCPKLMWLLKNRRDQEVQKWVKNSLTFLDSEAENNFKSQFQYKKGKPVETDLGMRATSGIWFEDYVFQYFQKKKKMYSFEDGISPWASSNEKHNFTEKIIASKKFNAYYQPFFAYKKFVTKCDIIFDHGEAGLDLYEVKAVNKIEGKQRIDDFTNDLLYQCWILNKLGYRLRNVYILHLNEGYLYEKKLDVAKLFRVDQDFSLLIHQKLEEDQHNNKIEQSATKALHFLEKDFTQVQIDLLNEGCREKKTSYCTRIIKKIKSKYNWLQLYRLMRKKKAKWYLENFGEEINLETIKINDFKLTKSQLRIVKVVQNLENVIKEKHKVDTQLKRYKTPIYFYDFETVNLAIPRFKKTKPWMQVPFQYSIHVTESADAKDYQHFDHVSEDKSDPRKDFIKKFINDMQRCGPGTYVAYNASFEAMILKGLLRSVELNEQKKMFIEQIINQTIDLMDFFKDFNIYEKDFFGSLSIKKTLPALVPGFEFSYKKLKIQKGDQASAFYFNYLYDLINSQEWSENIKNLREYCKLDSLAMLKIYQKIFNMVNEK